MLATKERDDMYSEAQTLQNTLGLREVCVISCVLYFHLAKAINLHVPYFISWVLTPKYYTFACTVVYKIRYKIW